MSEPTDVESTVRTRLRSLRTTLGLSLDDLAERTGIGASTISRIETGKRTISLDVLLPLASGLGVGVEALLETNSDGDVVIRPAPNRTQGLTTWLLSRPGSGTVAAKMRLEPVAGRPQQRVHPGHDWLFVLSGRVMLSLGEREIVVEIGEAAQFATMTPHAFTAIGGTAELLVIFDRAGHHAHLTRRRANRR